MGKIDNYPQEPNEQRIELPYSGKNFQKIINNGNID
jgi:hypothetical protein